VQAGAHLRLGGLDDAVRLLGTRPPEEMPAAFAAADVFCLPSWWEAMPLSILEAMATGLPVVATPVGDVPRVVRPYETGLLVPLQDEEALADALEELLTEPAKRAEWGRAARDLVVERHSAASMAAKIGALYVASTYK
ncbi:MAG TPA: glycosyltransferase family 4 protein, partial [Actinomycetota bacterium]|nr:glycosyltransferase family 4 protein [Actinomycetota bacterium]